MFTRSLLGLWFTLIASAFAQTLTPTADPYRTWAIAQWGAAIVNDPTKEAAVWGTSANPDRDIFTNLQEYAFGTDPRQFTQNPHTTDLGLTIPGYLSMNTRQRIDDAALLVIPQYSSDMQSWWPWLPRDSFSYTGDNAFFWNWAAGAIVNGVRNVTQVCNVPLSKGPALFTRLVVMRNNAAAFGSPFDALRFFDSVSATSRSVDSNSVVLTGFAGSVFISVTGGAHLIVNGVDVGTSATVAAGSTVSLRATSPTAPGSTPVSATYTLSIGSFSAAWTVTTRPIAMLSGVTSTVSGYTPVSVSVGEGGAANVSIPITVAPGTGGMEPKLAITYSSQGGNGLMGVGFGISGLSAISRTGSVQYLDGKKTGVSFGPDDRFTLDGQRLIPVSGADGGDGTEYRLEFDPTTRIHSYLQVGSGPRRWVVENKAGLTMQYGLNRNSWMIPEGGPSIMTWAVEKITDTNGNSIDITYGPNDPAGQAWQNGEIYVAKIAYTSNAAQSLTANQEVVFFYENRPDTRTGYVGGFAVKTTKRLLSIECRQAGIVARQYDFTYQQAEISGNSQLTQVLERGKQPSAGSPWQVFPPTVFTWDHNAAANTTLTTSSQSPGLAQMGYTNSSLTIQGDFNGDGIMDMMGLDGGGGPAFWIAYGQVGGSFDFHTGIGDFTVADAISMSGNLRTGDFNGDGRTDLFYISLDGTKDWIALARANGTFEVRRGAALGVLQNLALYSSLTQVFTMDANGDGLTDIVMIHPSDSRNTPSKVFLSSGNGSFTQKDPGAAFTALRVSDNGGTNKNWVLPGDYNGDGLEDILILYYNAAWSTMAISNGDGTFQVRASSQLGGLSNKGFSDYNYMVAVDVNGDGLSDVIDFVRGGVAWQAICKGDGTFETTTNPAPLQNTGTADSQYSQLLAGDFNGDGWVDLFEPYTSHPELYFVAYGSASSVFTPVIGAAIGALTGEVTYDPEHYLASRLYVGDFDGDGRDDVLDLNANKDNYLTYSLGFDANRIVQVTNGHGGYTKFNYKPLTDPTVYTKGTTAVYPNYDVAGAMYVVSSVVSRNGVDGDAFTVQANPTIGESKTDYTYERARSLLNGRGFQGFAATQATNLETGIVSRTEYNTADPDLTGRPVRQVQTLADGHVLGETLTTWTANPIPLPNGKLTHFPYATQSVSKEYEINNAIGSAPVKTTTVSGTAYDAYGNLTDSTTDYGGGFYEVTHSVFTNDTAHWWLGRLSDTTVTQTSPGPVSVSRHSTFEYSPANGQLNKETIITPENNLKLEKTYVHDGFGNISQSTLKDLGTGEARTTTTTYSPDGRFILQTRNHLGHTESKTYDPLNGTVLTQTGPNGLSTLWSYDAFGRPQHEFHPDGTDTLMQYMRVTPGAGVPARSVHAVLAQATGQPWKYTFYDVLDREIGAMAPHFSGQLLITQKAYDNRGQLTTASLPFFSGGTPLYTVNEFDPIGRVKKQTAPGTRITSTAYAGLTASVTNPKLQTFASSSDLRGRTSSSTSFGTDTVTNTHDPYGNLLKVDDGQGHVTTISYDGRGQKTSMTEPNSGTTTYTYNAFGEIKSQTDSLNRQTFFYYDSLGRLIKRLDPEGGVLVETDWEYDTAQFGIGKLARVYRLSDGYQESYRYDTLGRLTENLTQIGAMKFVTSSTFDEFGRPLAITYPTGFAIKNEYSGDGYLLRVRDAVSNSTFWTAVTYNERGQLIEELLGNGLTTRRAFDPNTGLVQTIKTGTGTGASVNPTAQNLACQFDSIGNLTQRQDLRRGITENFTYDSRNQLSGITGNSADPITIACDQFGNIANRSDLGTYTYGENGAGPHAVTSIKDASNVTQRTLHYDAAGNCTQDGLTVLAYNSSNQPTDIRNGSATLLFSYTPAHTRYRLIQQQGGAQTERLYIGSLYEREATAAGLVHTHFIPAGGGIVAIHTQTQTLDASSATVTASKTRYVHKDHLGSLHTLTREDGSVDEVLDFDAWGRRRTLDSATHRYTYASVQSQTDRGFTGHEMLDAVGLIHMNGRIYDPTLGRFLSVDPLVQEPGNLQNYNRYSYVLNNPLSLTDPSGFSFLGGIGKWFGKHWQSVVQVVGTALYFIPGIGTAIALGINVALSFGSAFTGTLLAGGSIGDAFRAGAISGAATFASAEASSAVGDAFAKGGALASLPSELKPIVHGVVQGSIGAAEGGKFTHGFLSASFADFAGGYTSKIGGGSSLAVAERTAIASVVGGTAAALGGGKFANGAATGAFVHLFNAEDLFGSHSSSSNGKLGGKPWSEKALDQFVQDQKYDGFTYVIQNNDNVLLYDSHGTYYGRSTSFDSQSELNIPLIGPETREVIISAAKIYLPALAESLPRGIGEGPGMGPGLYFFFQDNFGDHSITGGGQSYRQIQDMFRKLNGP